MSDYIFSSVVQSKGKLSKCIESIYEKDPPQVMEFHGKWGSIAVSKNHYHGFLPFETDAHLLILIGGPVLYFSDNDFLTEEDSDKASKKIYQHWITENKMRWDEDLSGPFTVILINKEKRTLEVVTDLMAFIPVYLCQKNNIVFCGTHIDALAMSCNEYSNFDNVSMADFIINSVVTYPYTIYKNIRQLSPGSIITFKNNEQQIKKYWEPVEQVYYRNIKDASCALRKGITEYINRITEKMEHVAQFISAGEDSRALAGMISSRLKRDAFIFLDHMNREGKIARKIAEIYGTDFTAGYRSETHYLDILQEASKLVGSGNQYVHAHSLGFDKKYSLRNYSAVFGGYLSDSLLKAAYARKIRGKHRFPFMPDIYVKGETRTRPIKVEYIKEDILLTLTNRRNEHFKRVKRFRPTSAHEWFVLWPMTMRLTISNLYSTRRLFKSYEPYMCKEAVKVSASVPISWKLNRRLFNHAMKPFLKKSIWLFHADGRLPYFSWRFNVPIHFSVWLYRKFLNKLNISQGNQGPWGDWKLIFSNRNYHDFLKQAKKQYPDFLNRSIGDVLENHANTTLQKINLIQTSFLLESSIKSNQ